MSDDNRPSPFRIPVTLLLGLAMPPFGLMAWIALSGSQRAEYLRSRTVIAGIAIGVVSALPLLAVAAASALGLWPDPNPNPVGLGFLLVAGGGVATILLLVGILVVSRK